MVKRSTFNRRITHAWMLVRATTFSARDDTVSALRVLNRVFVDRSGSWPEELPLLAAVRYAYLYERMDEPAKAIQALRGALVALDRGMDVDWGLLKKPTREYLYFYCKWLFARVAHTDEFAAASALSIGGSFRTLDLAATPRILRKWFPIPADAAKDVDSLIEGRMPKTGFSRA